MRRRLLPLSLGVLALVSLVYLCLSGGPAALALTIVLSLAAALVFRHFADDKALITNIFLIALAARLVFGLFVHILDLREFFGGDALTYDFLGNELLLRWTDAIRIPNPTV